MDLPRKTPEARFIAPPARVIPDQGALDAAAMRINAAAKVTLLVGIGAREARNDVLALAEHLAAPMVLTLKAKEGLERDNPFQVGQTGLIGNPAARKALDDGDLLLMLGTDFPYRDWYPEGKVVVQVDARGANIGRRTQVDVGVVGDTALAARGLLEKLTAKPDRSHLEDAVSAYAAWREDQLQLADPDYEHSGLIEKVRSKFDNPDSRIRPEALADAVNTHAAPDAIFTSDTGMSTVWLSRFVELTGTRRLIGSYNLGSMANAMPQALGAQALDRRRQVIAFCGDGGLTMLLGDLLTAVSHDLDVKLVVFDNGRLGMVKLEQEQGGLPEFGTVLENPDLAAVARAIGLHGVRVENPADLHSAVPAALAHPGPVLLDVITNPDEISVPPRVKVGDGWGFAIAKLGEELESHRR